MSALLDSLKKLYTDQDTHGFTTMDFLYAFGSPVEGLAYSKMFWPDFVVFKEMVFRCDVIEDESDEQNILDLLQELKGDYAHVERRFNRVEVPEGLFGRRAHESTRDNDLALASALVEMWSSRLKCLFPESNYTAELETSDDDWIYVTCYRVS